MVAGRYFALLHYETRKLGTVNISYFGHASRIYLPDFDAFVWRLPSGTQTNSQVCFR